MSGYSDAFQMLMDGNYTGAVTTGYTHGLQIGNFFYLLLMFTLLIPMYIKTKSLMMVSLTLLVMAGSGMMVNVAFNEVGLTANLNFIAIFALIFAIGFGLPLYRLLKRRE